ncbi:hypothetical protein HHK36_025462 [Tetracentron sinense]|uniref:Uncharacterized protein n=1 Tax=Tetracentron sinense TaxID=13715 RepID=A0A834YHL7_TETSI|nr:hypothetical protein HHK36_025462 [Tetracentron sinense]
MDECEDGFVSWDVVEKRVRGLMDSEEGKVVRDEVMAMRDGAEAAMGEGGSARLALAKVHAYAELRGADKLATLVDCSDDRYGRLYYRISFSLLPLLARPLSPVVQVTRTVAVPVQEEQQGATIAADIVAPTQTVVAPTVAAPVSLRRSSRDRRSAMSSDYEVYLNEVMETNACISWVLALQTCQRLEVSTIKSPSKSNGRRGSFFNNVRHRVGPVSFFSISISISITTSDTAGIGDQREPRTREYNFYHGCSVLDYHGRSFYSPASSTTKSIMTDAIATLLGEDLYSDCKHLAAGTSTLSQGWGLGPYLVFSWIKKRSVAGRPSLTGSSEIHDVVAV